MHGSFAETDQPWLRPLASIVLMFSCTFSRLFWRLYLDCATCNYRGEVYQAIRPGTRLLNLSVSGIINTGLRLLSVPNDSYWI